MCNCTKKSITWEVLAHAVDETNRQEKEIINRLVRQYGNLVFDSFHKQIDVYDQRRQAWVDVYTDWERAGKPFDQQDRLIDWLEAGYPQRHARHHRPDPREAEVRGRTAAGQIAPNQPAEPAKPPTAPGGGESPQKAKQESNKPPVTSPPNQPAETPKRQEPSKLPTPEKPKADADKSPAKAAPISRPRRRNRRRLPAAASHPQRRSRKATSRR